MEIKVLGTGCPKCNALTRNVQRALDELGSSVEVTKVTDIGEINAHGVLLTPALVIDGTVKVSGRVAPVVEIREWLTTDL